MSYARRRALAAAWFFAHYGGAVKHYRSTVTELFVTSDPTGGQRVVAKHTAFERNGIDDKWTRVWTRYATRAGLNVDRVWETQFVGQNAQQTVLKVRWAYHISSPEDGHVACVQPDLACLLWA